MPQNEITRIHELVWELRVIDVMRSDVITVEPQTSMAELRAVLRANRISGVPVAADGKLIGIISLEDFIRWLTDGAAECMVADRMTTQVTVAYDDEPLVGAVSKLERLGFGRLPIISGSTGNLVGVLTKGDIIVGLLKKLDVDYRLAETRNRAHEILQAIITDQSALTLEYRVSGGDLARAGASAGGVKTALKRLGISPAVVRRVAIATYEAEMNLIFYTSGGRIVVKVEADRIHLTVEDDGPGIADVDQAMQPGFSTASDSIRELGFGAGMGLCNILASADKMDLKSDLGKGTLLQVEILMENEK